MTLTQTSDVLDVVTPEYLSGLFSSEQFLGKLNEAASATREAGIETKFRVLKTCDQAEPWYSKVGRGFRHGFTEIREDLERTIEDFKQRPESSLDRHGIYTLLFLHFHPDHDLTPSDGDLAIPYMLIEFNRSSAVEVPSIIINGRVDRRKIDLLLYQQIVDVPGDAAYFQALTDFIDPLPKKREFIANPTLFTLKYRLPFRPRPMASKEERIAEFTAAMPYVTTHGLRQKGYKAAVVRLNADGIYPQDLPAVDQFAFDVKRYEK